MRPRACRATGWPPEHTRNAGTNKKAGREYGPARKKVKTSRGEHHAAEWEETAARFTCLGSLFGSCDEYDSKIAPDRKNFPPMHGVQSVPSGLEPRGARWFCDNDMHKTRTQGASHDPFKCDALQDNLT
jgi:hypothetical protein